MHSESLALRVFRPYGALITGAAIVFGAALFMLPAMLNGFPFLSPDSSRYLAHIVRLWSSPYYGWLIYPLHFDKFVWGVVIAQCLILSHMLLVVTRLHASPSHDKAVFVVLTICLTAFSSLPYFSGLIMPDIFAAIMFLALYLLVFHFGELSLGEKVYFLALASISVSIHFSHIPIAIPTIPVAAVLLYWLRRSGRLVATRVVLMTIPLMLAASAFFLANLIVFASPAVFPSGPNFLLGNMIEYGPARHYLEAACPAAGYKVCPYVNQLPATANKFLWTQDFLLGRLDFTAVGQEASDIVLNTIKTRPIEVAHMLARNSLLALASYAPATDLQFFERFDAEMTAALAPFGPATQEAWHQSAEHRGQVPHLLLERIQDVVMPVTALLLAVGCLLAYRRRDVSSCTLALFVGSAYVGNAVFCSFTSGIWDRYQARLSWLLVLAAILLWASLLTRKDRSD